MPSAQECRFVWKITLRKASVHKADRGVLQLCLNKGGVSTEAHGREVFSLGVSEGAASFYAKLHHSLLLSRGILCALLLSCRYELVA